MVILVFIEFLAKNHLVALSEVNTAILRQFIKYREHGETITLTAVTREKLLLTCFLRGLSSTAIVMKIR